MFKNICNKFLEFIKKNYKDLIFIVIILFIAFYKLPYVIYHPGGSINLNSRITSSLNYETKGSYSMNYVSVTKATIPTVIASFIIKDWDLKKTEEVTISDYDYDTTFKIEQLEYQNSISTALKVAYEKAGKTFNITSYNKVIISLEESSNTNLELFDEIVLVDGINFDSLKEVQKYISSLGTDRRVDFDIIRDGENEKAYAYTYEYQGRIIVGISFIDKLEYNLDPEIQIKSKSSEAGSSGGLMLSLAIYDTLLEEDLTKGRTVMGTGTMSYDGTVGEIGGIKYKLLGAQKDHADIFFVPKENYDEAKEVYDKYDLDFDLVMVNNFDEAINYLSK